MGGAQLLVARLQIHEVIETGDQLLDFVFATYPFVGGLKRGLFFNLHV
ncbi:hypothetical protein SDC9_188016 [bioreactor metagenome]|uniref:Uncharacterized protein n=1 Tax=bioreactor metagenome TaxID=1076179 RepID=A0A645HN66_9ZZZZ